MFQLFFACVPSVQLDKFKTRLKSRSKHWHFYLANDQIRIGKVIFCIQNRKQSLEKHWTLVNQLFREFSASLAVLELKLGHLFLSILIPLPFMLEQIRHYYWQLFGEREKNKIVYFVTLVKLKWESRRERKVNFTCNICYF